MPLYYHLPKIHKLLTNPPGHPIIAGIGSLTRPMSQYIDQFLQKHITALGSYHHARGPKGFYFQGISFILTHNTFTFLDKLYHQCCGTAMGTKFAPSYANLFMRAFKTKHIIESTWSKNIVVYKRYIDDLFFNLEWGKEGV